LRGDPSDRLAGARGAGAKGSATLLRRCGTLERIVAEGRLTEQAGALKLYKRLAAMDATAPLPALGNQTPDWAQAAILAREWKLSQLVRRFDERSVSRVPARSTSATTPPRKVSAEARAARGWAAADPEDRDVQREQCEPAADKSARLDWPVETRRNCLQELRCTDSVFPAEVLHDAGYDAVWRGQRTYNGVAILAKANEPY
jgi:hypothetical protein